MSLRTVINHLNVSVIRHRRTLLSILFLQRGHLKFTARRQLCVLSDLSARNYALCLQCLGRVFMRLL
jgi:hypothetical protein